MLLCHTARTIEFDALLLRQSAFLKSLLQTHIHTRYPGKHIALASYINWVPDLLSTLCFFFLPHPCLFQDVLLMGEELVSDPYYCQLEAETCRLFSEQLGTFALVGESLHMGAAKRLRLVLFSDAYCSTLEYNIRVYCMDDTQDVFKVNL